MGTTLLSAGRLKPKRTQTFSQHATKTLVLRQDVTGR